MPHVLYSWIPKEYGSRVTDHDLLLLLGATQIVERIGKHEPARAASAIAGTEELPGGELPWITGN
jgi:hypothetical protein